MAKHRVYSQSGYVALVSVLIVSAALTTVVVALPLMAVGESQVALARLHSAQSRALVESCVADVLLHIQQEEALPTVVVFPEGECDVILEAQTDDTWDVVVQGGAQGITTTVQFTATRTNVVAVTAWQQE